MKMKVLGPALLLGASLSTSIATPAAGDTWLELLHGWGYNKDFNGGRERTILRFKTLQRWAYGSVFISYGITGPFTAEDAEVVPNEKGGMDGSISVNFSIKKIGEKIARAESRPWGAVTDVSLHVEVEQTPRIGAVTYVGPWIDIAVPHFDYFAASAVLRDDWSLRGVDLQLGAAWGVTVPLAKVTSIVFLGYFQWGVFGEGRGVMTEGPDAQGRYKRVAVTGRPFFITQPQLLFDIGKLSTLVDRTLYVGLEYQLAWNRYLVQGATEHVPQLIFKWLI